MCGIAGLISGRQVDDALVRSMASRIAHRGPDGAGVWIDPEAGVGLGHRRLAIVDLSPAGQQPMVSNDGRWVLNFNGEIYNHAAIRADLDASGRGPATNGTPTPNAPTTNASENAPAAPKNRRNGHSQKTVSGDRGDLPLRTPRDRECQVCDPEVHP